MTEFVSEADLPSDKILESVIAIYNGGKAVYHNYHIDSNTLGAGQPLTNESVAHIFRFINRADFSQSYSFKNILPANVLKFSNEELFVVWHTKAQKKQLFFKNDVVPTGEYPIPRILWVLRGRKLKVFALAKEPTGEGTKVYMAPFMNISANGDVCMGSAKFSTHSQYYDDIITSVEEAFFNSYFTHTNFNTLIKGNYVEFMQEHQGLSKFPLKVLSEIPTKNIKDAIK